MAVEVTVRLRFEFDEYLPTFTDIEDDIERTFFDEDMPVLAEVIDVEEV